MGHDIEVAGKIRGLAGANRYSITPHAYQRMKERNVRVGDIESALRQASSCIASGEPNRWKVMGPDLDGDRLVVIVMLDPDLVVVTVYG